MRRHLALAALCLLAGCEKERRDAPLAPTWDNGVQALLEEACQDCHRRDEAAAGVRVDSYYATLGCTSDGQPAVQPQGPEAPLVAVLDTPSHEGLVDADQRALLVEWVSLGSPKFRGTVHPGDVMDPRSDEWHGALAAQEGWGPLSDPGHPLNCGRCHGGAPSSPDGITSPAPEATSCTTCHRGEQAVLDCSTCHGDGRSRSYPPRDACYFDPALEAGAHAGHLEDLAVRAEPYACTACHPMPAADAVFEGPHMDGELQVRFDTALAGELGSFDPDAETCAVGCHAREGETPEPTWAALGEGEALGCDDCHRSPPEAHYVGACNLCHAEMGAGADSLTPGALHLNGQVDVGDGAGTCGSCHGEDDTGWPTSASHVAHREQAVAEPLLCVECHRVPDAVDASGHLDGQAQVVFSGRALRDGLEARYAEDGTCSEVACHAAWLRDPAPAPVWGEAGEPGCQLCHGAPPPAPHTADPGCSGVLCHGSMVAEWPDGPRITESGRGTHLDGEL